MGHEEDKSLETAFWGGQDDTFEEFEEIVAELNGVRDVSEILANHPNRRDIFDQRDVPLFSHNAEIRDLGEIPPPSVVVSHRDQGCRLRERKSE